MNPSNDQLNEYQLESVLGGAPKETIEEFQKTGELSIDELDTVLGGIDRTVGVANALENPELYRASVIEREKAAMFAELDQAQETNLGQNIQSK